MASCIGFFFGMVKKLKARPGEAGLWLNTCRGASVELSFNYMSVPIVAQKILAVRLYQNEPHFQTFPQHYCQSLIVVNRNVYFTGVLIYFDPRQPGYPPENDTADFCVFHNSGFITAKPSSE
jgi:hypothetical protein